MKNFKFRIYENNYNVRILSHEENIIDLEVNGTSYSVKLKEEIKATKTPTLVRSASKRPEPLKVNSNTSNAKVVAPIPGTVLSIDVKVGDVIMRIDPRYFRPAEVETLLGDPSKAKEKLGWVPQITVEEMCAEMVQHDLDKAKQHAFLREHGHKVAVSIDNQG